MAMFAAAYVTVWLAVVLYVARMGAIQRRIEQSLETMRAELETICHSDDSCSTGRYGKPDGVSEVHLSRGISAGAAPTTAGRH